jgi:hypothetical protein
VAVAPSIGLSITLGRGNSASSGSIDSSLAISDSNSSSTSGVGGENLGRTPACLQHLS